MELLFAQIEEQKKEVCIISLSQLKLEGEVKAKHDDDEEDDTDELQEEILEEVNELPHDRATKQTQYLLQKALKSVDIIKCTSKLTPAS